MKLAQSRYLLLLTRTTEIEEKGQSKKTDDIQTTNTKVRQSLLNKWTNSNSKVRQILLNKWSKNNSNLHEVRCWGSKWAH